jgi:hypothetical protein
MPFKDLDICLRAAAAILQGSDPYSIPNLEVFYPLPFYFLFIPLASLPLPVVYALWSALSAGVLIAILRQRVVWVALSMPVLLTFLLGQVDIVMMALYVALRSSVGAGIALAFLVLKPQLVLLLAPWMVWHWARRERRQIVLFLIVLGALVALSFLVQPDWLARFVARSGERTRAAISSSVWGLLAFLPASLWLPVTALVVAAIVIWVWRRDDFDLVAVAGLFVSPFIFSYNLLPLWALIRSPIILVMLTVASWVAFVIAANAWNDAAAALIALASLVWLVRQQTNSKSIVKSN